MCAHNLFWLSIKMQNLRTIIQINQPHSGCPQLISVPLTTAGCALRSRDVLCTAACLVITCFRPLGNIMKRSFLSGEFLNTLSGAYWLSVSSWRSWGHAGHCIRKISRASREVELIVRHKASVEVDLLLQYYSCGWYWSCSILCFSKEICHHAVKTAFWRKSKCF